MKPVRVLTRKHTLLERWFWTFYLQKFCTFQSPHWKRLRCWERLKAGGEGGDRGEIVGWHHWLSGHEFEWAPGVGDGWGSLVCCSQWGRKELDTSEQLNWTKPPEVWEIYFCCLSYASHDLQFNFVTVQSNHIVWVSIYFKV